MAYMNQQKKSVIKTNLDKALKGTGVKFSLSVRNNSSICCTIKSAPIIDLTGPDGNAFVLIRTANKFARQLSLDAEKITAEMKSGDYENLVMTFDRYFGEYVILER
jgi:hypothetical protein